MTNPRQTEFHRPASIERKPPKLPVEFEDENAVEDFLKSVRHKALQLKGQRFTDDEIGEKAQAYSAAFNAELIEDIRRFKVPVRLSGEGILEPNSEIGIAKISDTKKAVVVQFDVNEGYRPVSTFESREGIIESIYAQGFGLLDTEGARTGENVLQVRYVIRALQPMERHVQHETDYFDAVHVQAWPAYIAAADVVTIESVALQKVREGMLLQHQLVEMGFAGVIFRRNLEKLAQEFRGEKKYEYTQLEGLKRLQSLGNLAGTLAKRGPEQAEVVKKAIFEVLNIGKPLVVAGVSSMPVAGQEEFVSVQGKVSGQVWGLQLPESETDPTVPALILDEKDSPDSSRLYVFEFSEIQGVKF
ncbi:MAG: hypothetical protein JWM52_82 [Candidatus Saccharibacteria bacterium]|nr:hypothetical protein [Candidatus Saccharibacteria bacterium]